MPKQLTRDDQAQPTKSERFRWLFWLLAVVVLGCAVGLFARMKNTAPEAPAIEPKVRRWSVATLPAKPTNIAPTLPVTGTIVAPQGALLTAKTSAAVEKVHQLAGTTVQAGAPLISLDNDTQRINLSSREAQLASTEAQLSAEVARAQSDRDALAQEKRLQQLAQSAYNRQQKLQKRDLGAQSRVDEAAQALAQRKLAVIQRQLQVSQADSRRAQLQAAVEQARSTTALAELDVQRTQITAPFAGRIQSISVSVGQQVAPGQSLVSLYATEQLEIRVQLTPRRLRQLQTAIASGQKNLITASGDVDGTAITATLQRLGADIAAGSGAVDAFLRITSGNQALQPGRTVEMDLALPALNNVVAMPPAALYGNSRAYVLAENDDEQQHMRSVQVTIVGEQRKADGELWLLGRSDGFAEGEQLIITQIPGAADGVAVQKVSTEPTDKPGKPPAKKPSAAENTADDKATS